MNFLLYVCGGAGRSAVVIRLLLLLLALLAGRFYSRWARVGGSNKWRHVRRSSVGSGQHKSIFFDKALFRRLMELFRICFPRLLSAESGLLILLALLLTVRTTFKLKLARIVGACGNALVQKDFKRFAFGVADILLYAIPTAATTFGVAYTKSTMEQCFRKRVQGVLHEEYFEGHKVYKLAIMNFVDNPSHRLTTDVRCFCRELASVFAAVIQPVIDIIIFSFYFARNGGCAAPLLMLSYYTLVAFLLRALLPNFAALIARSRGHEGNLRALHTQLVRHAEEVSFYRGEQAECNNADRLLKLYIRAEQSIKNAKWWSMLVNTLLLRDGATCVAHVVCALILRRGKNHLDTAQLAQLFLSSAQLLVPFSNAVGKLFLLHLKVSALCGSAHRVGELRDYLCAADVRVQNDAPGTVVELADSDEIRFSNVSIASPADQTILSDFTAVFSKGRHALITGDNGSGKTALLRSLCGLWPLRGGTLTRPLLSHLFFSPQRVYLPPGSLRTQFIYPAVEGEAGRARDEELLQFAKDVGLDAVVRREGGLDAQRPWAKVLSGGERQRVAIVRALYHQPTFVFLDECTSAVSQDVEPLLYEILQRRGMTLVTVSHHEALRSFHQQFLNIERDGGYAISKRNGF